MLLTISSPSSPMSLTTSLPLQDIEIDEHNLYRRAKDPWCPTTKERSLIWEKFAPKLTIGAAKDVIREWGGDPLTITHVITNTR